ncbi:sigma-70 family RNA polymerase sigma factor [Candidatus Poribacteria bacterium]
MRTEDGYIIQQCLDGDSAMFGFLVDKYKRSVYALAYSQVHNFHDAQDITQEVFIKVYRNLHTLRIWDNFMGWLSRTTLNTCKNWIRAESRRPDSDFVEDQTKNKLSRSYINSYYEDRLCESIREALDSLPEIYCQVLILRYFGGMTVKEISRFLSVSPSTVDRRLREAIARLREEILTMMNMTKKRYELPSSFTFGIVEIVKRIRINPMLRTAGLPWGLSLAAGIIIAVIGLSSHLNINDNIAIPTASSSLIGTSTLRASEIPVEILKTSEILAKSTRQPNGDGSGNDISEMQNSLLMAPQAEGGTWTKKADMPARRYNLSASAANGKIYAIGGYSADPPVGYTSVVEEYDPVRDKWSKKADMPTKRAMLRTCAVNGKIYAIGGFNGGAKPLSVVEEYDPEKDTWTRKTDLPTPRFHFATSVTNGRIYTIGGSDDLLVGQIFSTVEEYDPVSDKWMERADMPTPRRRLGVCSVDGKIYAIGGENHAAILSTVEEYDAMTDTWTRNADMLVRRFDEGEFVISVGERIYAIGGNNPQMISAVEEYDVLADKWTRKPSMSWKRCQFGSSEINGKIYVIGGSLEEANKSEISPLVEEYDPGTGQNINLKGKLPTTWGEVRTALQK